MQASDKLYTSASFFGYVWLATYTMMSQLRMLEIVQYVDILSNENVITYRINNSK